MEIELIHLNDQGVLDPAYRLEQVRERDWMNDSPERFAYRCLPLAVANQHGWAIYPTAPVIAKIVDQTSDMISSVEKIKILQDRNNIASSHFGVDVITFSFRFIVRTPPGYSLWIGGAPNHTLRGAQALTGIYETDWAPMSFTMNWRFTEYDYNVMWKPTDPIAFIFPIKRQDIKDFTLVHKSHNHPSVKEFYDEFRHWTGARASYISAHREGKPNPENDRRKRAWQGHYIRGEMPSGGKCPIDDHTVKFRLNERTEKE